jgi:phenylpropionate dioxygenase-like ring-hydroxylating dioxygenase large terminal subunit
VTTTDVARELLPPEAYWSRRWFALEQERLFARCWNMVGTVEDIADGGVLGAVVAGRNVAVSRDATGDLVAFEPGAPRGGKTERIAVDCWGCYVFVHLAPSDAPSLAGWLGAFPERIGGFHPEELVEVARYQFELAANWKFFVENHIDVYHIWFLHAASLGAYDHARATWDSIGPHWVFYEPARRDVDVHDEAFWRGLLPIPDIGEERWGSGAHLVFPNLTLATGAGFFMTYQCIPVAPDRSVVDLRLRAVPEANPTASMETSRRIIEHEDGDACEAMQATVVSPWYGVGPLARTHELPIIRFHDAIREAMR